MIRKPSGAEQESRLHAAVGSALETGAELRATGRKVRRVGSKIYLYYFFGMMAFGLIFSSTPFWFKVVVLALGAWLFKAWKGWIERRDQLG